jgi:hypothetical protein
MDGQQPPEHADILGGVVEVVYCPQNTLMLWQCIIAGTKKCFEGHTHPQPPPKIHPQAWRVVAHPFKVSGWSARPHVGCYYRGPFPPAAAMVVVVVRPVVFCAKATKILKNVMKTLNLIVCYQ